jgi:DNA-binding transcriptional ArsR family regulator
MKKLEKTLKAFANRRRLAMLDFINEKEKASVGQIAGEIGLSFKSTSKHLAVLFAADLVEREQSGLQMLYSIAPEKRKVVNTVLGL